ncbi:RAMP superfamily CRISPR-associated protein [Aerosakkonemataceae cyanobacterium BLCC-F50]|uniref:RAMP superfamily CRISPR-associated protein n=1 Tax=Floridaenema flaviceps BLCC-F50 TaxID=3153642 RepID=A0ABV4Y342_9CYAN
MHKQLVNHCTIDLSLIPDSPILIKSGKEGADPTKPDMEFVETYHAGTRSIYLPGSSLKGAIRAHAERIVRTVGSDRYDSKKPWANDPLNDKYDYLKDKSSAEIYKLSSFTDQIFGNTSIASRIRIEAEKLKNLLKELSTDQQSYYLVRLPHKISGICLNLPVDFPGFEGQMFNEKLEVRWKK